MKYSRFDGFSRRPSSIIICSEELVDGYQTVPYQPGALIWGGQFSDSVSKPF